MSVQAQVSLKNQLEDVIKLRKLKDDALRNMKELRALVNKLKKYNKVSVGLDRVEYYANKIEKELNNLVSTYPTIGKLYRAYSSLALPFYNLEGYVEDLLKQALYIKHLRQKIKEPYDDLNIIIKICDQILETKEALACALHDMNIILYYNLGIENAEERANIIDQL